MDAERTPEDILVAARAIVGSGGQITLPYDAGDAHVGFSSRRILCEHIARAILAERNRCAKIAETADIETESDGSYERQVENARRDIAAAIRTP